MAPELARRVDQQVDHRSELEQLSAYAAKILNQLLSGNRSKIPDILFTQLESDNYDDAQETVENMILERGFQGPKNKVNDAKLQKIVKDLATSLIISYLEGKTK